MTRFKKQLPEGVEDLLPQECYFKNELESGLRGIFIGAGYDEVSTPTYEYYDSFANGVGSLLQEKMIKFFDLKGSILALRPDSTIPIARMAASKLMDQTENQRLFYFEKSFLNEKPAVGRSCEYSQAGIELIGDSGLGGDVEVISIAIESLLTCGLDSFKIDIGQVSLFKSLIADNDFDDQTVDSIRHYVDMKNEFELLKLLDSLDVSDALKQKLCSLMTLFGNQEVFKKARALCSDKQASNAVDHLENVYNLLCDFGYSEYISIDFGMLHDISYYTGVIFRGLTDGIGFPIINGGRYDHLLNDFGKDAGATGFTLFLKRIMIVLEKQSKLSGFYTSDYVVSCDQTNSKQAFTFVTGKRKQGKRVLFCACLDQEKLIQLKSEKNAYEAIYFSKEGEVISL